MQDLSKFSDAELEAIAAGQPAAPDPDTDALVRTVWGEARGEGPVGRKAVASVIRNRAKLAGQPVREIVTANDGRTWQFEPWGNPERRAEMEALDPSSDEYQGILRDIQGDDDPTGGATHFYSPKGQAALGRPAPEWDDGSGFDLGGHRFFRIGYSLDGQPQAAPDLESLSEEELERIARGEGEADDFLGPVEFVSAPSSVMRAGKGYVDADTGEDLNEAQSATYAALAKSGKLDPNARSGSDAFPKAQRHPDDLPKPGDWYVSVDGELQQVPPVSWGGTALAAAADAGDVILPLGGMMGAGILDRITPDNPRWEAMKRAGQSGILLGGRNEVVATGPAISGLIEGGVPLMADRFRETLDAEDRASAQARRDFPLAYDLTAATGALASGAVIPAGRIPTLATGALGGFLSTDGDLGDRALGAGLGAAGGYAASKALPAVGEVAMDLVGVPRRQASQAMDQADQALRRLGVSADDLTPTARVALEDQLARGLEPEDAAVIALNEGLPARVPLRRGDVTGLPGDQLDFNMALRGALGPEPAGEAQALVQRQQGALRDNAEAIAQRMRGDGVPMRGQGGELVSDALVTMRQGQKAGVDAAYTAAREQGDGAWIARDQVPQLAARLRGVVAEFVPDDITSTRSALSRLDNLGGTAQVRDLFDLRQTLSTVRGKGGPDAAAAGNAVRELDRFIEEAVREDLFNGDVKAIQTWKKAIKAHREYAEVFKQGDLIDRLTQETGSGGARQLAVEAGDAANYILGRSNLGFVGRKNLYRDLSKVRDLLGADSEAWNALRAESFLRLANSAEGAVEGGVQQFSGVKFQKAWSDAKARDMRMIDLLFKPEERSTIDQFAALAAKVTGPVKGGDNSSNTAVAAKALQRLAGGTLAVGKMTPFIHQAFEFLEKAGKQAAGKRAMEPIPRRVPRNVQTRQTGSAAAAYGGASVATSPEPR